MRGVFPLIRKEFLHIRRARRGLSLALFGPLFLMIVFGYAITLDIKDIPLLVWDQEGSRTSRELIDRFVNSGRFVLLPTASAEKERDFFLETGQARVLMTIPPDFSARIRSGKSAPLQVILDGSDSNTAAVTLGYVNAVLESFSAQILAEIVVERAPSAFSRPPFTTRPRIWFNPELKSVYFIVPGIIGVIMMVVAVGLTSMALVQEREQGTMEALLASPLRPLPMVVGKLVPYGLIALIDILLILAASVLLFRLPFRGDLLTLIVPTCLFLLASLGMGLLISTLVDSQQAAWMTSLVLTLLPAIILSGFIFPLESMPWVVQTISYFFPLRYFLVVLRGVILKGAGFDDLLPQIQALAVFAFVILAVNAWRFQKAMR